MKTVDRSVSGACPTYFRALCHTASLGGEHTYAWAGRGLVSGLHQLAPYDVEEDEWAERIAALADLICPPGQLVGLRRPDDAPILEWFVRELPRCMASCPRVVDTSSSRVSIASSSTKRTTSPTANLPPALPRRGPADLWSMGHRFGRASIRREIPQLRYLRAESKRQLADLSPGPDTSIDVSQN